MYLNSLEEVKRLTEEMVAIESIVRGEEGGETKVAQYIENFYKELDYFKENPNHLILQKTINDEVSRHNCIALVKGKKGNSNKTIILMGHIDTVGVDDFHQLKEYAFNCKELPAKLRELNLSDKINKDIDSGEYLFGRGALDMKGGVAGHMYLMKYFAEHPEELDGNLVHLAECDEEDNSHGVISALKIFSKWKEEFGLEYVAAINADYSTPYHSEDEDRYVYFGTIGKLLPAFYVTGKESHVGLAFNGLDPNQIVGEITRLMNLNTDLCDEAQGEVTIPPISLKQSDTKVGYTVQTALSAYSYYNFFTHRMSPRDVIGKVKEIGIRAFDNVIDNLNSEYKKFCELRGNKFQNLPWKNRVYTWEELCFELEEEHGEKFKNDMNDFAKKLNEENPKMDLRDFSIGIIEHVWKNWVFDKSPAVIIFYASTYSAPIEITGKDEREEVLLKSVKESIEKVQVGYERKIVQKYFYPYISDASFMAIDSNLDSLKALELNMPSWGNKYVHPIEDILKINIPVINIGTIGYDGHGIAERVDIKYTFEIVPNIAYNTILGVLN